MKLSVSHYGAPILFTCKKEGMLQMCIDFSMLNKQTNINAYLLLKIDDILDYLCKAQVFLIIDLRCITGLLLSHHIYTKPLSLPSTDCTNYYFYYYDWSIHQKHFNGLLTPLFKRILNISCWLTLMTY